MTQQSMECQTMEMEDIFKRNPMLTGTCMSYSLISLFHSYSLNISKRVYKNDLEHLTVLLPISLVNGFLFPYSTSALLLTYLVGRNFYTAGYF